MQCIQNLFIRTRNNRFGKKVFFEGSANPLAPPAGRNGSDRCTGPGPPGFRHAHGAREVLASVCAERTVQAALQAGAAISACAISWNAPLPSSSAARAPRAARPGLRSERGVKRRDRIGWPVRRTSADTHFAGEAAPGIGHVHRRGLVAHVQER